MSLLEINKRYSELAADECCLSCGNALSFAEPKTGEVCLDLGSGRGTDALRMAEKVGSSGFVYGIDISEGMIEKANQLKAKMSISNLEFIRTNLEQIPLKEASVDVVISNCTLNHASDKQLVWYEIYRILKPGGRFIVSDIYSINPVPEKYRNDPVAVSECWGGAVTRSEYMNHLQIAGFKKIDILEESAPYSKGETEVCSFTIFGVKSNSCCCK